ncbi:hypothetical protein ERX46_05340 [Brumimicrobium glaciale]|uniref:Uncharacterized protein n=1 Tax=Brumimicrobium glaciale TaxID=200475 RepID=A0A4Q4KRZ9_9FLAO|nr:hypothetical protein [Brumimicrobium glaciale]RYM34799.1 hypothetical protein ERX46_05340 [Brumimicrobium glaciale]
MNKKKISILILSILFLYSCKEGDKYQGPTKDFGISEYYKPFLFSKSDTLIISKTLKYDFNDYAFEQKSKIAIKLVDTSQNILTNKNIRLYINDEFVVNNEFEINSEKSVSGKIRIGIQLLPDYPAGYTSGFISISSHDLDIVNNTDLNTSSELRLFKWEANHKLIMNPLKKGLMWFSVIVLSILLLWFLVFRNRIYPKFKKGKIQILKPYFGGITFNRKAKLIVLTATQKKQKLLNKVFTGKVIYEVNTMYQEDIILRPGRGSKLKIKLPIGARISPSVINLEKFNKYSIQYNNESIEIQYS